MTTRQEFVKAAMQALITKCESISHAVILKEQIAERSCKIADAVIAEEAKTDNGTYVPDRPIEE